MVARSPQLARNTSGQLARTDKFLAWNSKTAGQKVP